MIKLSVKMSLGIIAPSWEPFHMCPGNGINSGLVTGEPGSATAGITLATVQVGYRGRRMFPYVNLPE